MYESRKAFRLDCRQKRPQGGGRIKVIAFITDFGAVDRIIDHLKLTFIAEKPPPSRVFDQVGLMAAEAPSDSFS